MSTSLVAKVPGSVLDKIADQRRLDVTAAQAVVTEDELRAQIAALGECHKTAYGASPAGAFRGDFVDLQHLDCAASLAVHRVGRRVIVVVTEIGTDDDERLGAAPQSVENPGDTDLLPHEVIILIFGYQPDSYEMIKMIFETIL